MPIQFPERRETDIQREERVQKIKEHNEAYGCDKDGNPVDAEGNPLKNLSKKEMDIFRRFK
jgi:hypothetical protein